MIRVGLNDPRPRPSQSGDWRTDILCREHEAALGDADKYAIELARRYLKSPRTIVPGKLVEVDNPRPDLLIRFAHAVVWRHVAALEARGFGHWLGPYFKRIEDAVFRGSPYLVVYAVDPNWQSQGERTLMAMNPCPANMPGLRLCRFDIGGLAFHMKTDKRDLPEEMEMLRLDRDPLSIGIMPPEEIGRNPHLRAIADAAARAGRLDS